MTFEVNVSCQGKYYAHFGEAEFEEDKLTKVFVYLFRSCHCEAHSNLCTSAWAETSTDQRNHAGKNSNKYVFGVVAHR